MISCSKLNAQMKTFSTVESIESRGLQICNRIPGENFPCFNGLLSAIWLRHFEPSPIVFRSGAAC